MDNFPSTSPESALTSTDSQTDAEIIATQPQLTSTDSQTDAEIIATQPHPAPRRWLPILIGALLLLGGFGLWRWWQGQQAAQQQAGAAQAQAAPVEIEAVQTGRIQEADEFISRLESRNSVQLSPEIDGRVSRIFVRPGDRVQAGTPLVQLSPEERQAEFASVLASVNSARAIRANAASEIQALQADRVARVAEVELQNTQRDRTAQLVNEGAIAREQLDIVERDLRTAISELAAIDQRIQAARANLAESEAALAQAQANANASNAQLQDTVVEAPFAGTVGDIPVRVGQVVSTDDTLTSVTQNNSLELQISIPLDRAADLQTVRRVELLDAEGNPISTGQINFTAPQVTPTAQTILVKAQFPNPTGQLLNDQFVRARVIWNEDSGILVPTAAISRLGGQSFIFVAEPLPPQAGQNQPQPQLVARQRQVELGDLQGNRYEVLEGLEAGEQIVVSGVLNLSDGIPINPVQQNPNQPAATQP